MKLLPVKRSRILFVCIGYAVLLLIVLYLFHSDRLKSICAFSKTPNKTLALISLFKPIEFRVDLFGMVYEGRSGNVIDDHILYFGAHEKFILFFLRDLAGKLDNQESVFLDIGANVGQHSLFMSKYVKKVHSFEPYPPVLDKFRKMVAINQINNIVIHPVGLGSESGQLPFFEPPDHNLGQGSFINKDGLASHDRTMSVVIGDEWLESIGLRQVDIIKCDVEGYEKLAFQGLKHTLDKNRPIIVMELNLGVEESFLSIEDFYSTFPRNYEYLVFCLSDIYEGRYKLCENDTIKFDGKNTYDIVVYPKEKKMLIPLESQVER